MVFVSIFFLGKRGVGYIYLERYYLNWGEEIWIKMLYDKVLVFGFKFIYKNEFKESLGDVWIFWGDVG